MSGYGMPEAEIRLLIKHPQTGEPISLQTLRKHFAEEIATGAVKAKALVGDRIVAWILGRDGDLQDDRTRVSLAILFAKARVGWTVANRQQSVDPAIDLEDAQQSLDKESPGSCDVSSLERLAELQRVERDKILNVVTGTKMSLASVSGTGSSNPSPSSGESGANLSSSISKQTRRVFRCCRS